MALITCPDCQTENSEDVVSCFNCGRSIELKKAQRDFIEARVFVRTLKLQSHREWQAYAKGARSDLPPKPDDIPDAPGHVYKNKGWQGIGDWLGINEEKPSKNFLDKNVEYIKKNWIRLLVIYVGLTILLQYFG
ncbi:MAG: hypothetical protein DK305_000992 [Chloroflexi bacterium]|jgi:hypothetical protein|nr:MAG: hypothetical protein DK305_000992 [Chloroflexota bacterium]|tara:strand:- start:1863 stop:2264 length:402 start_codon:yes stop_codon:yes gene_type:complete